LVFAVCVCGHQLYEELAICSICSLGFLDWCIHFDDFAPSAYGGRDGGAGAHPMKL